VPLDYALQNADIVEITTMKNSSPSLDWLKICKSSHAQNKIRQWFKKKQLPENIEHGKTLIENELRRFQLENLLNDAKLMDRVMRKFGFSKKDDLFAALGYGGVTTGQILGKLKDEVPKEVAEVLSPSRRPKASRKVKKEPLVKVEDLGNILVSFSKCCSPLPGDAIAGYITIGKGVSIHRLDCPNMVKMATYPDRMIKVQWTSEANKHHYIVDVRVEAWDRTGILADIMGVANNLEIPVINCIAAAKGKLAIIKLQIEILTLEQLKLIIKEFEKVKNVIRAFRLTHLGSKG
jgi:GTP diphosphokinase / guanosine-3',5'-bis(diphosphate) 3'-diphosphatase